MNTAASTPEFGSSVYQKMERSLEVVRGRLHRPLTLAEKVLFAHLDSPAESELIPGESDILLRPDRVAHQDVTGQMAILQFMQSGRSRVAVPTTVHCDHLIQARVGASPDLQDALNENNEVYRFLESACRKYDMGFWKPGAGIIHQVVLENYAFPGSLLIGTDSHTPNAGGLGMLAIGVGGADAADVMAGLPWEVKYPTFIGVHLTGELQGWTAPKDVIIYLAGVLTVAGGTNAIIEYFGPGTRSISCTGKATITNMGAELGATGDIFPFDERMVTYLRATRRGELADLAGKYRHLLTADPEVEQDPAQYYDRIVEIDLSRLEPQITGPHSPDRARPISALAREVRENDFPDKISVALVGSCTNSSYEDMSRVADVARQAKAHGLNVQSPLPGHLRVGADPGYHPAGRPAGCDGGDWRDGAGQRLWALYRPVEPARVKAGGAQHHRDLLQPQLPPPQRWQCGDYELHSQPRANCGTGPGRQAYLQPLDRYPGGRRRPAIPAGAA